MLLFLVLATSVFGQQRDPNWNRPTAIERMGASFNQFTPASNQADVIQAKLRAKAAKEKAHADDVAAIQAIANNPANYRIVTGQVYNVMLSGYWRWLPDQSKVSFLEDYRGLVIFKEGGRTIAVTNFVGTATSPKRARVLQIGEVKYQGRRIPLFDYGTKPVAPTNAVVGTVSGSAVAPTNAVVGTVSGSAVK